MVTSPLIQPVILSGGSGTRLWPLSTPERPKQFLRLIGDETMLQATLRRVSAARFLPPLIIANANHRAEIERQLDEIGVHERALILEPVGRNTAPAIALAALQCAPETPLLVMPSDHVIQDVEEFRSAVDEALPALREGYLVTFGISPTHEETGYGYIKAGKALVPSVAEVERFVEKPDSEAAAAYLEQGGYFWNAGIFLFRAGDFLVALNEHTPDILAACKEALADATVEPGIVTPEESSFAKSPAISVDYAVMEKASRVAVAPIDVGWSDIGSWDALADLAGTARDGSSEGPAIVKIDCDGCLVRSDHPVVAAIGVRDLIIVATKDAVLVLPRGSSQQVRKAVETLKSHSGGEILH